MPVLAQKNAENVQESVEIQSMHRNYHSRLDDLLSQISKCKVAKGAAAEKVQEAQNQSFSGGENKLQTFRNRAKAQKQAEIAQNPEKNEQKSML